MKGVLKGLATRRAGAGTGTPTLQRPLQASVSMRSIGIQSHHWPLESSRCLPRAGALRGAQLGDCGSRSGGGGGGVCSGRGGSGVGSSSISSIGHSSVVAAAAASAGGPPTPPPPSSPGPITEEELRALGDREKAEEEEALAAAWREQFDGDVQSLYDYVERDQELYMNKVEMALEVPKAMRERQGAMLGLDGLPAGMASDMVGMGSWRLRNAVDDIVGFMIGRLEGLLREILEDDLTMYPPEKWKDIGWDFVDSMDPKGEWDGWSFADIADPAKGEEGYPRLQLENRVYCSRVFRKLHLEVAVRQDGLQALHVVLFPRYDYDLPILAMDIVIAGGTVTLAVADACPLSPNLSLPRHYLQTMHELQKEFLDEPAGSREVPDWGKAIFSPLAVCMRPAGEEGVAGFIKYCVALTRAHLMYSTLLSPVDPRTKSGARRLAELTAGHERFVRNQLSNKKTTRVIEAAFGTEMSNAYMEKLVFDFDPTDSPPWYDGSISRLYHHFEKRPEPWKDGEQLLATRQKLDVDKSQLFLERFLAGESSIAGERLQFALATMYDADEDFRAAVNASMPDLPLLRLTGSAEIGARLEQELMQLMTSAQQQQKQQKPAPPPKQTAPSQPAQPKSEGGGGAGP